MVERLILVVVRLYPSPLNFGPSKEEEEGSSRERVEGMN